MAAPVLPAVTKPAALPSRTSLRPTRMELSRLAAHGVGGLLVHADALGGVVDDDGQVLVFEVLVEQVAQLRLGPDEMHAHGQRAAGEDGSANLRLGSLIGTNGVERDVGKHRNWSYLASFTSSTARPLYAPHLGQARWGSFFSWQLGHSERPTAVRKSWERRLAVRRVEWRLFGFGMMFPFDFRPVDRGVHQRARSTAHDSRCTRQIFRT
jgi:hypothetical protein